MATRKDKPRRAETKKSATPSARSRRDRVPLGLPLQVDLEEYGATPEIRAAAREANLLAAAALRAQSGPDRHLREREVRRSPDYRERPAGR